MILTGWKQCCCPCKFDVNGIDLRSVLPLMNRGLQCALLIYQYKMLSESYEHHIASLSTTIPRSNFGRCCCLQGALEQMWCITARRFTVTKWNKEKQCLRW